MGGGEAEGEQVGGHLGGEGEDGEVEEGEREGGEERGGGNVCFPGVGAVSDCGFGF